MRNKQGVSKNREDLARTTRNNYDQAKTTGHSSKINLTNEISFKLRILSHGIFSKIDFLTMDYLSKLDSKVMNSPEKKDAPELKTNIYGADITSSSASWDYEAEAGF